MFRIGLAFFLGMLLMPIVAAAEAVRPTWSEDFNRLSADEWETQLFSFPANGCNMTATSVGVKSGTLALAVAINTESSQSAPKMCNAGEVGSYRFFTYGLFTVRMKVPAISGGVSSFFLMNRWEAENWEHKEIDIELLGKNSSAIQMTTHDFQNGGRIWKRAPTTVDMKLNYSQQFHDYAILWTPQAVRWYVDGRLLHTETSYVPNEPLQIRMSTYLGDQGEPGVEQWLGPLDASKVPAEADFRSIAYYPLDALPSSFVVEGK